ncbi:hypothetical protein VTJ49DRAFT_7100 [Mycothermus thermophilus]|uniref:Uncharacterized protein n=1 Tax=Humicola insolens TaxID=85995 RepID=A0ABR3V0H8_HUMIN
MSPFLGLTVKTLGGPSSIRVQTWFRPVVQLRLRLTRLQPGVTPSMRLTRSGWGS